MVINISSESHPTLTKGTVILNPYYDRNGNWTGKYDPTVVGQVVGGGNITSTGANTAMQSFYNGPGTTTTTNTGTVKTGTGTKTTTNTKTSSGTSAPSGNWLDYYKGWDPKVAEQDFKNTFGGDINKLMAARGVSSGGGGGSETDIFAQLFGQLAGSPYELPPLQVKSWEEYEAEALEELKPYYERLLKEEGGDVEKAKARLGQDYERGIRINTEDYAAKLKDYGPPMEPGETTQHYYNRTKDVYGMNPNEGIDLLDTLAKRKILSSGIATVDASKLQTAQQRRQEALTNAKTRYEEEAGLKQTRGLEDINTAWDRRQFELGEQEKQNAATMGRQARADDIATQEIERANIMRKAIENIYS